jgi:membrane associated rhomboid family serine protease
MSYYRTRSTRSGISFYFPGFPPGVKWLITANVAVFLLGIVTAGSATVADFISTLRLVPQAVVEFFAIWELATYMFLHGSFSHIIWNMLALWMFGAEIEREWGTKKFLQFYFFCGVGAGICIVIANYLAHTPRTPTIGASGAIFGILLAYAMLFPNRTILWGFLIPIQVKWFVLIIGVISFVSALYGGNTGVSEFAHLGGLLFAYVYMKTPRLQFDLVGPVRQRYKTWKLQRAKRKFQVYLKKQGSDRDPWLH